MQRLLSISGYMVALTTLESVSFHPCYHTCTYLPGSLMAR